MRAVHKRGTAFATFGFAAVLTVAMVATPTSAGAAGTQKVQEPQHLCKAAKPGHMSCDAIRLVTRRVSNQQAAQLRADGLARPSKRLGTGPAGGYTPKQIAAAYGIKPNAKTKQTVAIVDAFDNPSVKSDLNFFDKHYGLHKETKKSFKVINQQGHASPLPAPDPGWAGEITLDVQSVRAVCHRCKILLVEADNNQNANLATAVDRAVKKGAKIVSNSYGGPEGKGHAKSYSHKGVAILASTGDDGWYGWDNVNFGTPSMSKSQTPASFKSVVAVGGTSLYLNPNGSRASEDVWNDNGPADIYGVSAANTFGFGPGAAGSGCSKLFKAPSWQKHVKGYKSLGCGSHRSGVDIAAIADEFTGFDVYETFAWCGSCEPDGWATFGGTSLASPVVAGLWGLAGGPHKGVKFAAKTLYDNFKHKKKATYDVGVGGTGGCDTQSPKSCNGILPFVIYGGSFTGSNPNDGPGGLVDCAWKAHGARVLNNRAQCYAQPGYDGVSGVGTPKGLSIFK
ncbi:MAG: S53 family peptidase [Nocardioides sp.]